PTPSGATTTIRILRDVRYDTVNGLRLRLDVYEPGDGLLHPAVVLIHGGAWARGDKSEWGSEGQQLALAGFVAFAADYRLAPPGALRGSPRRRSTRSTRPTHRCTSRTRRTRSPSPCPRRTTWRAPSRPRASPTSSRSSPAPSTLERTRARCGRRHSPSCPST